MRPSTARANRSARELARDLLVRIERDDAWATPLLVHYEPRLKDARDAALLHRLVIGVLQQRRLLDHALAAVSCRSVDEMDPDVRAALRIGVYSLFFLDRVPDHAAVAEAVSLVGRQRTGFVNGVLRSVVRRGRSVLPPAPREPDCDGLARFHSFPTWWVERRVSRIGWDRCDRMLRALNRPPGTVLRADSRRIGVDELVRVLEDSEIAVERGRYVPEALRIVRGSFGRSGLAERGVCRVQDEAAQLVGELAGPSVGPRTLDLCAAPGGKTLQLAERLVAGGVHVALDRNPARVSTLVGNLDRHDAAGVGVVVGDAKRPPFRERSFDLVLLDAPCSGSGTLRRHPELRWRSRLQDLKLFASEQARMLRAAASLTIPGGAMIYAVCSVEPEEGEDVVNRFLKEHTEFEPVDARRFLPTPSAVLVGEDGYLRTVEADGELDGFFAARLGRREGAV